MREFRIITSGAARIVVLAALLLALVMAPVVVASSHGPGAMLYAAQTDVADHSNDPLHAAAVGQHDATDHEHQLVAVLLNSGNCEFDLQSVLPITQERRGYGPSRDGPRRPPRDALI